MYSLESVYRFNLVSLLVISTFHQISNTTEAWMRPISDHWAVSFLNRDPSTSAEISVSLDKLKLPTKKVEGFDALDLFTGKYYGYMTPDAIFNCTVAPNGVTFLRFGMAE